MNTAIKWDNRILTNIRTAVKEAKVDRFIDITVPQNHPSIVLTKLNTSTTTDLNAVDIGATLAYQVDVRCIGKQRVSTAQQIIDKVINAFREMGCGSMEISEAQPEMSDMYRLTARFRWYVGSGNEIKKLEQ